MTYYKNLLNCILLTAITLIVIHYSDLDIKFQSLFFDFETKKWLIDKDEQTIKFIFYKLPKYLIVTYGVSMIFMLAKLRYFKQELELQKKLLFLILVLIITPLTVAILKNFSPINCPNHIHEFGGCCQHISPLDIFNKVLFFGYAGKCFPAGHASGGFSLISLYFVMSTKRAKHIALFGSITLGSIMGLYQIAKGVHYLSDTIFTASIAYMVCVSARRLVFGKY